VTEQYRRDPTATNRIIVPRGRPLVFTYAVPPVPDPAIALRNAMADVIARDTEAVGFSRFVVAESSGLSVVPESSVCRTPDHVGLACALRSGPARVRAQRGDGRPVSPALVGRGF